LGLGEKDSHEGFGEPSPAGHGGMLCELIDQIAAGFRTDLVEQTVALGIGEGEEAIANKEKAGKVNK
jgi:hypothetical protein